MRYCRVMLERVAGIAGGHAAAERADHRLYEAGAAQVCGAPLVVESTRDEEQVKDFRPRGCLEEGAVNGVVRGG